MRFFDSHAHLSDRRLSRQLPAVLERARENGVDRILNVGADLSSSRDAVAQAQECRGVYASVGIHPHDAKNASPGAYDELLALCDSPEVVAWGEIGLDYHYDFSPREVQRRVFHEQMLLAYDKGLPVIVHDREAHGDTLQELRQWKGKLRGVLHCFSGSVEMACECLRMGFYISIAGPVTFKNARKLVDVAREVPLERLLIETDCPYLTPVPHRGKRNEPAYVRFVAEKISEIRGLPLEQVAEQTYRNTLDLFGIIGE